MASTFPKLHFAWHYVELIKPYGTTDNFNTEYTEQLHINLAKDAYQATNFKNKFSQMTLWLKHKEKVLRHDQYINWWLGGSPVPEPCEWSPPRLELEWKLSVAKHPSAWAVSLDHLEREYRAVFFRVALRCFIARSNEPHLTAAQLEQKLWNVRLPFRKVPMWHKIKYLHQDPFTKIMSTADSIHVWPSTTDKWSHPVPGRFDTALINDGTGGNTGVQGTNPSSFNFRHC